MDSSKLAWFNEARYGMFIHWGPYSVAGRGEWIYNRERIPFAEYRERYAAAWRAEQYDPRRWAALAKAAGMKYMVLTTRHHDGFCLWDTRTTDWCATRLGPGRDLVRPYVEACRAEGLRVGFYYSGADWRHPDYPDAYARDWPTAWRDEPSHQRLVAYCAAQVEELLTQYGPIDILWYDGCIPCPFADESFNRRVYELQPQIIINERMGKPYDYENSEQTIRAKTGAWEACMTLNENWGYFAGDDNYKTARDVVRMLITCAKDGGNLLLNVGPRADGAIPAESERILRASGEWLARNGEWLYGSTRAPFSWSCSGVLSTKGTTVYVHLLKSPGPELCVAEIANRVKAARWLHDGRPVRFTQTTDRLFLHDLPCPLPDPIGLTIALDVEGEPRALTAQGTFWVPG